MRQREVQCLTHGNRADKWLSWDFNLDNLPPKPVYLTIALYCLFRDTKMKKIEALQLRDPWPVGKTATESQGS